MIFHNRQRNIESIAPKLTLNGHQIERVTDFNFLGLNIDQHMSWNSHINKISLKMSKTIGILCKLKRYLPPGNSPHDIQFPNNASHSIWYFMLGT